MRNYQKEIQNNLKEKEEDLKNHPAQESKGKDLKFGANVNKLDLSNCNQSR